MRLCLYLLNQGIYSKLLFLRFFNIIVIQLKTPLPVLHPLVEGRTEGRRGDHVAPPFQSQSWGCCWWCKPPWGWPSPSGTRKSHKELNQDCKVDDWRYWCVFWPKSILWPWPCGLFSGCKISGTQHPDLLQRPRSVLRSLQAHETLWLKLLVIYLSPMQQSASTKAFIASTTSGVRTASKWSWPSCPWCPCQP